MSVSLPDVQLASSVWTELYAATGISAGKPLIIQNKITAPCTIQIKSSTPTTTTDGYNLAAGATIYIGGTTPGCWIRCTTAGRIVVMENDEVAS